LRDCSVTGSTAAVNNASDNAWLGCCVTFTAG